MGLAEEHRLHITRWFYDCGYDIHRGLGDMYVGDPRFTARYEEIAPGLAQFLRAGDTCQCSARRRELSVERPADGGDPDRPYRARLWIML